MPGYPPAPRVTSGYTGQQPGSSGCLRSGSVSIDYEGDEHLYAQLARILMDRIDSGEIPPRRPIPSKRALREEHQVSAGTVERALDVLKAAGYIRTLPGRGLYVQPPSQRKPQPALPKPPRRRGGRAR